MTGSLAEPEYRELLINIAWRLKKMNVIGFKIERLVQEEPRYTTNKYKNPSSISQMPTALTGICKEDALSVMIQGSQISSHALIEKYQKRDEFKN